MKISNPVEVCNLALSRIGQNTVSSLDDSTVQGQVCNHCYEQSKSSLLSAYPWSFAIRTAELNQLDNDDPLGQFLYKYALPDGYLRWYKVYGDKKKVHMEDLTKTPPMAYRELRIDNPNSPPFLIEGRRLYSDYKDVVLKYVHDEDNVAHFSPKFIDALYLKLAIDLTKIFNDSSTYLQQLESDFSIALAEARRSDAAQTLMTGLSEGPILRSTWGF